MADTDPMQDYFSGLAGQGLGVTSVPNDWSPDSAWAPSQPAQVTVNAAPPTGAGGNVAAPAAAPAQAMQAPPPPASGLGSWFSMLGGGGAPAAAQPGTAPGWQQGAVGLGLGLLSGNPFNKWGKALEGYQRGAAADVARQQLANTYGYQQQQLAQTARLQREHMALQRELAYKPQIHFAEEEDPETGYKRSRAFISYPQTGEIKEITPGNAEKLAGQEGNFVRSVYNPISGKNEIVPPGVNLREYRQQMTKLQADIDAGKITIPQAGMILYNRFFGGGGPAQTLQKPPSGVPPGAIRQESNRGNVRWRVKDKEGRTLFYDNEGKLISQK